jgi:hypothetical protein
VQDASRKYHWVQRAQCPNAQSSSGGEPIGSRVQYSTVGLCPNGQLVTQKCTPHEQSSWNSSIPLLTSSRRGTAQRFRTMAEVAGLILGAVPLLISALEHYEDFVEPTVAFFKWKGQLSKVTRRLLMGHTAYEQSVRLLLKQVVNNEDLVDMIDYPQSDYWKSDCLVKDLREKLGSAYQPTFSTIQEIADIMVSVAASLNIDGSDKVWRTAHPDSPWERCELTLLTGYTRGIGGHRFRQHPSPRDAHSPAEVPLPEARVFYHETPSRKQEAGTARRVQRKTVQLFGEGCETSG